MNRNLKRAILIGTWVAAVVGWLLYQRSTGLGTTGALQEFIDSARGAWWALLAFVLFYAARPVVLFPASLLTIAGGILFGPVLGVVATVMGANASAMVAYWLARFLGFEAGGEGSEREGSGNMVARWSSRLRAESFTTIMVMRLAFLPYDLVNYTAGLLRIRPLSFLAATAIGSLPGTVSFTLAGASIERLDEGVGGVDPRVLIASAALFVVSVGIAQYLKRREPSGALSSI